MPRRRRPARPGALADLAPTRILSQIVLLQIAYYACASVLILFTALVAGKEISLDLLLSWRSLRGDVTGGWMLGLVWMLNSLICVIFLLILVARSKLVPDFALTIHFLHLITTSLYSHSLPATWFWWALQTASVSLMTVLGVWSCRWRELQPIAFGGKGAATAGRSTTAAPAAVGAAANSGQAEAAGPSGDPEDDGAGYVRGTRRGRGRDGAGQYEMVPVTGNREVAP